MNTNVLRKEAKLMKIPRYSTMSKNELVEAIRKIKYKDASSQTDGPYCTKCVEIAYEKNLEKYLQQLTEKSRCIVHDGDLLINAKTGVVIGCDIDYQRMEFYRKIFLQNLYFYLCGAPRRYRIRRRESK